MSRWEQTFKRDLSYSQWHRTLDDDITFVDIDAVEYCNNCYSPLTVMELAKDVGQHKKSFMITFNVAKGLDVPGYVVLYSPNEAAEDPKDMVTGMRVMKIYPTISEFSAVTPEQFSGWLRHLHDNCYCKAHGQDSKKAS